MFYQFSQLPDHAVLLDDLKIQTFQRIKRCTAGIHGLEPMGSRTVMSKTGSSGPRKIEKILDELKGTA